MKQFYTYTRTAWNKKAKKSFCPRASDGNTHHEMRYAGEKLFSYANIAITRLNSLTKSKSSENQYFVTISI